ncbi:DUF1775 domain-containing protein [Streptomyces sp. NPDC059679]|uniref:DUF1775 domain-containing protein n=1 Tax=Streptomyces sp. NPDC059679 TaxID=3346903 RepID=UPI00367AABB0
MATETRHTGAKRLLPRLAALLAAGAGVAVAVALAAVGAGGGASEAIPGIPEAGAMTAWGLPVARTLMDVASVATVGALLLVVVLLPGGRKLTATQLRYLNWAAAAAALWGAASVAALVFTLSDLFATPVAGIASPAVLADSAGFRELRIVLPVGIAPDDVSLAGAPKGWRLKATADGYTVGGPALKPGVNAEHKIKVNRLPDAKQIAFKTVETYSDGEVSRWIELPRGGDEPEQPAPVLQLKAAAPDAKPAGPSSASSPAPDEISSADSAAEQDATSAAEKTSGESDGVSSGVLIGAIVAVLLVLAGGAWWLIRRRASASQS